MMLIIENFAAHQTRLIPINIRSSRSHMLYKIVVLKRLKKLPKKTPVLESLFNLGVGLRSSTVLKRHTGTVGV